MLFYNPAKMEKIRKEKGLTQRAVADAAGIHLRTLTGFNLKHRRGGRVVNVRLDTINKIAAALGVKPESLLG